MITEEWNVACVGDSFNVCNQLRLPISQSVRERMAGPYPYYGPTSVQGWINEYRVEGEYALIGEDGDHFLKWRSQPMTLLVRGKFNVNNHAHLLRGTKNLTEWFYWFFANRDMTPYLTRQGAGRYKLTKAALIQIPCALPPPPEQRAIAGALSDVDELIGSLDQLIAKKRDLKQAAMQQLLTGQTRLPSFHGEWEVKRLGEVATIATGNTPPTRDTANYGDEFLFVSPVDLGEAKHVTTTEKRLSRKGFAISRRFPKGSILFVCIGSTIGKCGVALVELTSNQQINAIFPSPAFSVDYLYYFVSAAAPKIRALAGEQAVPIVNKTQFAETAVALPSLPEQTAIAEVLSDMDAELAALEQRRDKTRALKQGMMQELLTGRTRLV